MSNLLFRQDETDLSNFIQLHKNVNRNIYAVN